MSTIAYFGPQGTFSEQAAMVHAEPADTLVPLDTVPRALAAVRGGEADVACVPVENSVEGAVSATLDALAVDEPLVAIAEVVLPVRFSVLVAPGVGGEVRTVASHPHALAQVQGWLAEHLPAATQTAATSTAAAAVGVLAGTWDAAITAPVAATHYPLDVLATDVADVDGAMTRFLLLRRPGALPEPTGFDRTSLVMVASAERTGVLAELLTELALRGINLSRIESRPQKGWLGRYRFYLDFDGHIAESRVGDALAALHRRCEHVRFLGSYPKAGRGPVATANKLGNTDIDYATAQAWVSSVRGGQTG
ncbi:prephenate dehydratase [Actinophytocola sediminis]